MERCEIYDREMHAGTPLSFVVPKFLQPVRQAAYIEVLNSTGSTAVAMREGRGRIAGMLKSGAAQRF